MDRCTCALAGIMLLWTAVPALAVDLAPSYLGLTVRVDGPTNTHNSDHHETSKDPVPGIGAFAGWQVKSWLGIEANGLYAFQRAHGFNSRGKDENESVNGSYHILAVTIGPAFRLPVFDLFDLVAGASVGPSLNIRDTTRSSLTNRRDDCVCLEPAWRASGGAEKRFGPIAVRGGLSYTNIGLKVDDGRLAFFSAELSLVWYLDSRTVERLTDSGRNDR